MDEPTEVTRSNLKVTNKNDFRIEDRFDGVPFIFEPGKSLTIPADAALHIFGWHAGLDMANPEHAKAVRLHTQRRLGWNTPDMEATGRSSTYFKNLELKAVTYRLVEVEDIEAPAPKRREAAGAAA